MRFASIQCSKIRLRPWLRPGRPTPLNTAYTAPPANLAGFKEAASRRGGRGKEGEQNDREEGEGRLTLM